MPEQADYESDDRDDADRGVLRVFFGGNGDWYMQMHRAEPDGRTLPLHVRWCTSGGAHPWAAILCVAILFHIGRGQLDRALALARSMVQALGEDRDIEPRWPDAEG